MSLSTNSPPLPEIYIRAPSSTSINTTTSNDTNNDHHPPPSTAFLTASPWCVTYSTLQMWKSKCNVKITYKPLPEGLLDDQVTYQTCQGGSVKTVHGIDRPVFGSGPQQQKDRNKNDCLNGDSDHEGGSWGYHWRGTGWLVIASSRWEVLGYGSVPVAGADVDGTTSKVESVDWAVTYFAKTLFTPAGIDIYSRPSVKLPERLFEEIKKRLKTTGLEAVEQLVEELFLVKHDAN